MHVISAKLKTNIYHSNEYYLRPTHLFKCVLTLTILNFRTGYYNHGIVKSVYSNIGHNNKRSENALCLHIFSSRSYCMLSKRIIRFIII